MDYIYRDYTHSLSQQKSSYFLQALAISGGSITSSYCLKNAFPPEKVQYWTMFYRLKFYNQTDLDKFHEMGLRTTTPERVVGH